MRATHFVHVRRAVTLLETVLAVSLMVTFMGMMYWFYESSLETREEGLKRTHDVQLARVLLQRMAEEIRQASGNTPGYGTGLIGYKHGISVNTLVIPDKILAQKRSVFDEQIAAQFDLQEVRYYIAWDEENLDEEGNPRPLGLVRRVSKTFNRGVVFETDTEGEESEDEEAAAVKEELYAPEIKFLEFRYFDGASWWEDWELAQGNSLPLMVRVTVGYTPLLPEEEEELDLVEDNFLRDEEERDRIPDDQFTMFVRLVQSDVNPIGVRLQREASAFSASEGEL
ncbi:MAG: hypothetical protein ACYSUQ_06680 [Planctomycetota bacterium]|jgi:hypothetical protein